MAVQQLLDDYTDNINPLVPIYIPNSSQACLILGVIVTIVRFGRFPSEDHAPIKTPDRVLIQTLEVHGLRQNVVDNGTNNFFTICSNSVEQGLQPTCVWKLELSDQQQPFYFPLKHLVKNNNDFGAKKDFATLTPPHPQCHLFYNLDPQNPVPFE